jgi:hypothetical protein
MSESPDDRSILFTRWWVRRYTSGLGPGHIAMRRAEIDSDLAEHQRARESDGWTRSQIVRERRKRLVRGMAADVGWRHDLLRPHTGRSWHAALTSLTGIASLFLAAFHFVFAVFLFGSTSLADRRFLGGLAAYEEEVGRPIASPVAATVIALLGVVLVFAALSRPISPLVANIATIGVAAFAVLWFWLGMWLIGLVVIVGSTADLVTRVPDSPTRP